jgi:DNA-binding SARP family transcriptional activator/class 3 adenylate cyclase
MIGVTGPRSKGLSSAAEGARNATVLEIRLLGQLEAQDDERDLTPRRLKQRALLAALALRAGNPVSADRLVDDLWGESAPKSARHALENYVSELRKALGAETIATRPAGYVLDVDSDAVDAHRFERLVTEQRAAIPGERADQLREALGLVRGPPLADLAFEPFAQTEIPRLQELELRAREDLVEAELELGRHADAVLLVEPLVREHPYRERLRALLMIGLYRSGRQAAALAVYQEGRRVLVDELGIDPGDELQELERAILRQDPELGAPTGGVALAPGTSLPGTVRGPARKTVTVVFAELANSMALADRLDPEPLRAVLDRYLDAARNAVERHGGACGRLAGTAIVAVLGAPATHEDDALRAVRAAAELRDAVGVLNDGLLPEHGVYLQVRTALSTGEALVDTSSEDPATGRAVAHAHELSARAEPGQILLAEETYRLVKDVVAAEPVVSADELCFRLVELLPDAHGRILRLDSPLVGRRRQLAALASALEGAVADRTCHLFTVLGAAGVGKSRLIREFLEDLDDVALVLHGRCEPYGESVTFRPLVEALPATEADGLDRAEPTTESVRAVLARLARQQPLLVALDDMQWADERLLHLVDAVAAEIRDAPVLLLCSARPDLLDERPGWGGGKPNTTSMLLEPLTEAESERLLDNLLGDSDLPDPVRDYIVSSAEGNPLFVEELLATLVDRDVLRREAGRWTTTELPAIPLPPTIQALISARIDRLPDDERAVLELGSIEGRFFGLESVSELAPDELRTDLDAPIAELVRKELLRPEADEGRLSFRHQVIRDATYGSIPIQRRAELHDRLALLIERTSHDEELARQHRSQADTFRAALGSSPSEKPV